MPMSVYNKWFGGEKGAAGKAKAAMKSHYGAEKGESVFYAKVNKMKSRAGARELGRTRKKTS